MYVCIYIYIYTSIHTYSTLRIDSREKSSFQQMSANSAGFQSTKTPWFTRT